MAGRKIELYDVRPLTSIRNMMQMAHDESGERIAYKYRVGDHIEEVTYNQFFEDTMGIGTELFSRIDKKAHVAMVGDNSYRWITVYLTMLQSAGVFVPVDKEMPEEDMLRVLNHSDSEVVFYSAHLEKFFMDHRDQLPHVKFFVGVDREEDQGEFLSYTSFRDAGKAKIATGATHYTQLEKEVDEVRMLVYTSGTTGLAKGVMLTERNLIKMVYHGLQVSTVYETGLSVLPYHHTYEAVAGLLVEIHMRCTMCINEGLTTVAKNLQFYKPDFIYLVPAFVEVFYKKIMAKAKHEKKETLLKLLSKGVALTKKMGIKGKAPAAFKPILDVFGGRMRKIVCGGAPIRPELGEFFGSLGINLINGYGITECSPLVSVNQDNFNSYATAGYPIPCVEIKFEDVDSEGNGEICVKGDTVMAGYYKNPEATAEAIVDGWFHTGDYGHFNDNGQLVITGRKKNLIVLANGKNIFPEEIERYIDRIPYVQESVVFAIRDENGEEVGLAVEVFLNAEQVEKRKITCPEQSLRADVNKQTLLLPSYKHISQIFIRPVEFEKTSSKKIKRASCINAPKMPEHHGASQN